MSGHLSGYKVGKRLTSSTATEVYLAIREEDGLEVVLKSYVADRSGDPDAQAVHEFETLRRLNTRRVPRALDLDHGTERPTLVLERLPGASLGASLEAGRLGWRRWLQVAYGISEGLEAVHAQRVLHRNIAPRNVIIDLEQGAIGICGFGQAGDFGRAARPDRALGEGTGVALKYVAPEQTGRMNRGCDFRSDLYSLGATLYHALVGEPPFPTSDPLELIHAHIARVPKAPSQVDPEIPEALSRIVLKLLKKEPAERYQSARALREDLRTCLDDVARTGAVAVEFVAGGNDLPERPRFSSSLHGRRTERRILEQAYREAARGLTRSVWIRSEPGLGKSALVDALGPLVAGGRGHLSSGRFTPDQDRPYAAWIFALGGVVQQLLTESDAELERWRRRMLGGIGTISGALIDLVPDLVLVLGEIRPVPRLGPRETQVRLALALQRFIESCAAAEHPLVLFLDDLQWSDAASLMLLERVLAADVAGFLLIGAYRSGEVGELHPLAQLIETARGTSRAEVVVLAGLEREATVELLSEALERRPEDLDNLARLVELRTGNSPLLVRQLVEHMYERGLLRYERGLGWCWDDREIVAVDVPEGAAALIAGKVERVEIEARDVLAFASCVGDEFDTDLLLELGQKDRTALETALFRLAEAGLVAPSSRGFRFVHGRIREAARNLLGEAQRSRIHLEIAQLLIERLDEGQQEMRIFEIVGHLNHGIDLISEVFRTTAVKLNLAAGKRALGAGAGASARGYLAVAEGLLREADWEANRGLYFDVKMQAAESAFQCGEFDAVLGSTHLMGQRSLTESEWLQVELKRIQVLSVTQPPETCVTYALEALRRLGVRWPLHPSTLRAKVALRRVDRMLRGRTVDQALKPSSTSSFQDVATLLLLRQSGAVMARVDVNLTVLAVCVAIRHYLRHGYPLSAPGFALATYATNAYLVLQDARVAQKWGSSAAEWLSRVEDPIYGPRGSLLLHAALYPWLKKRRQALSAMDRVGERTREVGDPEFEYYARYLTCVFRALAGDRVIPTEKALRGLTESIRRAGTFYRQPGAAHAAYELLLDPKRSEEEVEEILQNQASADGPDVGHEPILAAVSMMILSVLGRHQVTWLRSEQIYDRMFRVVPYVHVGHFIFYRGLAASATADGLRGRSRWRRLHALWRCRRMLRRWARHGPDFGHMTLLLDGEIARLRGNPTKAKALYDQAARAAREQEFPHHSAMAYERKGRMLLAARRETEALEALRSARDLYEKWGAALKARFLAREIRELAGARVEEEAAAEG